MFTLSTIEISLGAAALTATAAGSFLIAGGALDQLPVFIALSLSVFAIAAGVVASRVTQYRLEMRTRLFYLLPAERACEPNADALESLVESELIELLESHLKQQDALLSANCHALMQGQTSEVDELLQAEDELRQLRSDIASLEDQFRTDQSLFKGSESNFSQFPFGGNNTQ